MKILRWKWQRIKVRKSGINEKPHAIIWKIKSVKIEVLLNYVSQITVVFYL